LPATDSEMPRVDLAYTQAYSSETARDMNRDVVLEIIRMHQPISRADLARISGLQRSTVSLISEQLIEERWVSEGATVALPRGRRPTLLALNDEIALLVADVHPSEAALAVVDLSGRFLARTVVPLSDDPIASIARIAEEMQRLRGEQRHKIFEGIGIAMPGRLDPATQKLIFAPNLGWKGVPIKQLMEEHTGLNTELENAANASLLAELWTGHLADVRNAVLVTISEGVGAGILANGRLVSGGHGMAGEFGHIPIDPQGPRCACGLRGCWEVFASCNAAVRIYRELSGKGSRTNILFQELLRRAESGDEKAIAALEQQARFIGLGMRAILSAVSPEIILITGRITSAWRRYDPAIREEIGKLLLGSIPMPRLVFLDEGETTRLRGAAAVVLQRHSKYHRSGIRDQAVTNFLPPR
jgi:predicted NBD/HSP70 family sugar kinase